MVHDRSLKRSYLLCEFWIPASLALAGTSSYLRRYDPAILRWPSQMTGIFELVLLAGTTHCCGQAVQAAHRSRVFQLFGKNRGSKRSDGDRDASEELRSEHAAGRDLFATLFLFSEHPTMRDAVLTALLRIKQQVPNLTTNNSEPPSGQRLQICQRSTILPRENNPFGPANVTFAEVGRMTSPDMRLMLRYPDVPNFRGTLNAMACLVEKHGLLQLQQVGVFGQGSGMHHVLCAK
jgi:hypothetical protein